MTDDLAAWLLARLEEDEAELREIAGHPWYGSMVPRLQVECDTRRRIIELHRSAGRLCTGDEDLPEAWHDYCATCGSGEPYEYPTYWPCDTLRLLALPYADLPGYRKEWRPDTR